jgi:hypothetical protein
MQTPGSSFPPIRAAIVTNGLYKSCACLHCLFYQKFRLNVLNRHDFIVLSAAWRDNIHTIAFVLAN